MTCVRFSVYETDFYGVLPYRYDVLVNSDLLLVEVSGSDYNRILEMDAYSCAFDDPVRASRYDTKIADVILGTLARGNKSVVVSEGDCDILSDIEVITLSSKNVEGSILETIIGESYD